MAVLWIFLALAVAVFSLLAFFRMKREQSLARNRQIFNRLALPDVSGDVFSAKQMTLLPPPAARYLRHAIQDGAPLTKTVDLHLIGEIRVKTAGDWFKFEAMERICPERGFLWQARIEGLGRLCAEGAEYLSGGHAGTDFYFAGIFPLVHVRDGEFARSAVIGLIAEFPSVHTRHHDPARAPVVADAVQVEVFHIHNRVCRQLTAQFGNQATITERRCGSPGRRKSPRST